MNMYTAIDWRGRGLASALLPNRGEEIARSGVRVVRLRATEAGKPIYRRAGFQAYDTEMIARWVEGEAAESARDSAG